MKYDKLNKWIAEWYEKYGAELFEMTKDIWEHPELGLKTYHAAEAALQFARTHGFPDAVKTKAGQGFDFCETGNAVIAEYGSGKPVIGIIGELDALPGLGNGAVDHRDPIEGPGQGCGHNLIAGACMGAACALRYAMEKEGIKGTLRMVECPGEEVGRGKALLAKDGAFKDMDMAIMWHPGSGEFSTEPQHPLCVMAATFEFHGKSAHAAGAPWNGRSALDAVQLMNMGSEFLREHVKTECRFHYQITDGGMAPNIVPDYAAVKYFCRAQHNDVVRDLYDRVVKNAEGAAHMTDTKLDANLIFIIPYFYENKPLCRHLDAVSRIIPEIEYSPEEIEWAKNLTRDYTGEAAPDKTEDVLPFCKKEYEEWGIGTTCTDTADISYFCPTAHIHGGGVVKAAPGHHWTVTACSGTTVGMKAMERASKVLAQGALEAFGDQKLIDECWEYFRSLNIPDYEKVYDLPIHDIQQA
jgi:aminobenzoyl-glutamate utilization protein B